MAHHLHLKLTKTAQGVAVEAGGTKTKAPVLIEEKYSCSLHMAGMEEAGRSSFVEVVAVGAVEAEAEGHCTLEKEAADTEADSLDIVAAVEEEVVAVKNVKGAEAEWVDGRIVEEDVGA